MIFFEELLPSLRAEELVSLLGQGEVLALAYIAVFFYLCQQPRRSKNRTAPKPK